MKSKLVNGTIQCNASKVGTGTAGTVSLESLKSSEQVTENDYLRAKPDLVCTVEPIAGSPLPVGHVDLRAVASGYSHSGFAVVLAEGNDVEDDACVVEQPQN